MHAKIGKYFLIVPHPLFFGLATLHGFGTEYPVGSPKVIIRRHMYCLGDQPWSQKLDPEQHVCLN